MNKESLTELTVQAERQNRLQGFLWRAPLCGVIAATLLTVELASVTRAETESYDSEQRSNEVVCSEFESRCTPISEDVLLSLFSFVDEEAALETIISTTSTTVVSTTTTMSSPPSTVSPPTTIPVAPPVEELPPPPVAEEPALPEEETPQPVDVPVEEEPLPSEPIGCEQILADALAVAPPSSRWQFFCRGPSAAHDGLTHPNEGYVEIFYRDYDDTDWHMYCTVLHEIEHTKQVDAGEVGEYSAAELEQRADALPRAHQCVPTLKKNGIIVYL